MKTNAFTKRFTKKLKSNTGASLLLALAFFLMCFFVASVVMASASVNASRALAQKEEQRSFFAIQSAQNLIKDMFTQINGTSIADTNRYKDIVLGTKDDGFGTPTPESVRVQGGFHFREVTAVYDPCGEDSTYQWYGKMQKTALGPVFVTDPSDPTRNIDVAYESEKYGLDCVGDESAVFAKEQIEEVATLVLCKRLHDKGINVLADNLAESHSSFVTYFNAVDDDFDISKEKVSESSDQLKYVYYFDIMPGDDIGAHKDNLPTVHVKMTADNKANLTFLLTVDSKYATTYSATVKARASFEMEQPKNARLDTFLRVEEKCNLYSKPGTDVLHVKTQTISDTYIKWYTNNIEITKGVKNQTKTTTK